MDGAGFCHGASGSLSKLRTKLDAQSVIYGL